MSGADMTDDPTLQLAVAREYLALADLLATGGEADCLGSTGRRNTSLSC